MHRIASIFTCETKPQFNYNLRTQFNKAKLHQNKELDKFKHFRLKIQEVTSKYIAITEK